MRIEEFFVFYMRWLRIAPKMKEAFDCRNITKIQFIGPRVSYDVDGINILAALIDDNGTTAMDVLEAGIPLNQGSDEIIWESAVGKILLLAATLEFQEAVSINNLHKVGEIGVKACLKRDSLSLDPLQTIHVHTSAKYEYWLESKSQDDKPIIHFTGKLRVLIDCAGANKANPVTSVPHKRYRSGQRRAQ